MKGIVWLNTFATVFCSLSLSFLEQQTTVGLFFRSVWSIIYLKKQKKVIFFLNNHFKTKGVYPSLNRQCGSLASKSIMKKLVSPPLLTKLYIFMMPSFGLSRLYSD